ncbi:DMT family transporter [Shewanella algae]|uniref:Aromatic amino acid exporter n=1 Tax=Shewanella algae TaxID=38313 RepID=A0A379YT43_9GAMM|nr:DMT family transporter [Shewanella algae]NJI83630.1 DMT family transporter [Shewanella sp. Iso12]AYV12844.1 DMT family transporter [Shewanella algae]MBO2577066.1 DMT family transporter [Shewanella algae]MBO2594251.1 DMT family transporter [Shewanella algae]MBO2606734.1 DMT family transporter [Shewanella algae]
MKKSQLALIYGMAAVFLWSTVATAFKIALGFFSPLQLVFVAVITSSVCLGLILAWQGKLKLLKQQFCARPWFYLQTGLLNPFLYYLVLFKAYDLLPAQQALSLNYTWAVLLPLLAAPMLQQKLQGSDMLAAVTGYCGVLVIATGGNLLSMDFANPFGILLALSSTLLWCLYWIINTKDKGDAIVSLMLSFLVSLPLITITLLTTESLPSLHWQALGAGVYVGLFEMGVTFVLWLMALRTTERAASITNLVFLTPLLSMVFIALILKETITLATLVGMGLILSALLIQKVLKPKAPKVNIV